ncbi:MAG TPA: acetyltransferase [Sphingomonas sp.]|nr:acetyltransferase [Sphingomonas sp.]
MIRAGTAADVPRALEIWRAAVDATHGFLTAEDRIEIDRMVAEQFLPNVSLVLAVDAADRPQGFLVMDGEMIDALFVDPAVHGRGIGTALVDHALTLAPNALVDASEQASNAVPFYESRGFVRIGRSEQDPQGRPYPLLHFRHPGATG